MVVRQPAQFAKVRKLVVQWPDLSRLVIMIDPGQPHERGGKISGPGVAGNSRWPFSPQIPFPSEMSEAIAPGKVRNGPRNRELASTDLSQVGYRIKRRIKLLPKHR